MILNRFRKNGACYTCDSACISWPTELFYHWYIAFLHKMLPLATKGTYARWKSGTVTFTRRKPNFLPIPKHLSSPLENGLGSWGLKPLSLCALLNKCYCSTVQAFHNSPLRTLANVGKEPLTCSHLDSFEMRERDSVQMICCTSNMLLYNSQTKPEPFCWHM